MAIKIVYEVMYRYSLADSPWEFSKRFYTYEEAEAWITDTLEYEYKHRSDNRFNNFIIQKVYKGT